MASSISYEDSLYRDISGAFNVACSLEKFSYDFASSISPRAEISKFTASVGSVNISSPP